MGDNASHWLKFTPNNTSAYLVVGSSGSVTFGHCAQFSATGALIDAGAPCGTGSGGSGGYAVEPATVTIQAAQGITVSTLTVYSATPNASDLVVKSTNNVAVFSVSNSSVTAGDFLIAISSVPGGGTNLMTVDTYGRLGIYAQTLAWIQASTPTVTWQMIGCTTCTPPKICVSTGVAAAYQYASATGAACN